MREQMFSLHSRILTPSERTALFQSMIALYEFQSDGLVMGESIVSIVIPRLIEELSLLDTPNGVINSTQVLNDILLLSDVIHQIKEAFLADGLLVEDVVSTLLFKLEIIINILGLSDDVDSQHVFVETLSVILALVDNANQAKSASVTDVFSLAESISVQAQYYTQMIDSIVYGDNAGFTGFIVSIADSISLVDIVSSQGLFKAIISNGINFFGSVNFDGEQFLAYAINTQSSGISQFTNYSFNSVSYPLAATSKGVYRLDSADDDEGTPITGSFKTGVIDFTAHFDLRKSSFRPSYKKQVPYAYLGISENGRLLFKTITTQNGIKKERWYEVNSRNTSLDTTRVRLGKGIKSKYWQFEISNIDGDDFFVNSLEVMPVILKRRKQ